MTELFTGYGIVLLIMFIGVMGHLIPGSPGTPLILAGAALLILCAVAILPKSLPTPETAPAAAE